MQTAGFFGVERGKWGRVLTGGSPCAIGEVLSEQVREVSKMIRRTWHGWTAYANADSYESLLKTEIFIFANSVP